MQRPLQEHIAHLEEKILNLKVQAVDLSRTADERYQSSLDLRIAQKALMHYRQAYKLEQQLAE